MSAYWLHTRDFAAYLLSDEFAPVDQMEREELLAEEVDEMLSDASVEAFNILHRWEVEREEEEYEREFAALLLAGK